MRPCAAGATLGLYGRAASSRCTAGWFEWHPRPRRNLARVQAPALAQQARPPAVWLRGRFWGQRGRGGGAWKLVTEQRAAEQVCSWATVVLDARVLHLAGNRGCKLEGRGEGQQGVRTCVASVWGCATDSRVGGSGRSAGWRAKQDEVGSSAGVGEGEACVGGKKTCGARAASGHGPCALTRSVRWCVFAGVVLNSSMRGWELLPRQSGRGAICLAGMGREQGRWGMWQRLAL